MGIEQNLYSDAEPTQDQVESIQNHWCNTTAATLNVSVSEIECSSEVVATDSSGRRLDDRFQIILKAFLEAGLVDKLQELLDENDYVDIEDLVNDVLLKFVQVVSDDDFMGAITPGEGGVSSSTRTKVNIEADVNYLVKAFQCNENGNAIDNPVAKTPNSVLNLCIRTESADVEIEEVRGLRLEQVDSDDSVISNGVKFYAIGTADANNGFVHPLATYNPVVQSQSEPRTHFVQTRLISSFFALVDDETSVRDVVASGVVLLKFSGGERRLSKGKQQRVLKATNRVTSFFSVIVPTELEQEDTQTSSSSEDFTAHGVRTMHNIAVYTFALFGMLALL